MSENRASDVGCETFGASIPASEFPKVFNSYSIQQPRVSGHIGGNPASNPTLAGKADTIGKITALVVEPACGHDRSDTLRLAHGQHPLPE